MPPGPPVVAGTSPNVPAPVGSLRGVSARRPRTSVRTLRSVLVWVMCSSIVAACAEPPPTVGSGAPTTTSTTDPGPVVPPPTDGALRTRIDATGTKAEAAGDADDVLLVGDSVLVLIADDLAAELEGTLHVDAVDCRELADPSGGGCGGVPEGVTIDSGIEAITRALAEADRESLPDAAVLVLANNATLTAEDVDAAMGAAAGIERVWWVNARIDGFGRQDLNNAVLDELAARDPRAGVIDWFEASEGQEWFADHVHPNETGQRALAHLVAKNLA